MSSWSIILFWGEKTKSLNPDQYNPLSDLCLMKAKLFLNKCAWTWNYFGMITQAIHYTGILFFEQITQIPLIFIYSHHHFFFFFLLLLLQLLWYSAPKEHTGNAERLTWSWQPAHKNLTGSEQFLFSAAFFFLFFETSTGALLSRLSEGKCLSTNQLGLGLGFLLFWGFF